MGWTTLLGIVCMFCTLSQCVAVPLENAHDAIMKVNDAIFSTRNSSMTAAEDKIVDVNEGDGLDLFEGDIKLSDEEYQMYYGAGSRKRNVVVDRRSSWRTRTIPYVIDHYGTEQVTGAETKSRIKRAMNVIMSKVPCLTFREKQPSDKHYIRFYKGVGCWSYIGKRFLAPNTDVSLGSGCLSQPLIIHEIMHALGFFHEQSRPDRDSFITVMYENINQNTQKEFQRMKASQALVQGTLYDYDSIMHYSTTSFTANGKPTMLAKFDPAKKLGGIILSALDIWELNKIYQCHVSSSAIWSDWTPWTACLQYGPSCKRIRQRFCLLENKAYCPGADEFGILDETIPCSTCAEPMDGHWNNWGAWSTCSKQCDEGMKTRQRVCDNPMPSNGGKSCLGSKSETVLCRIKKCNQKWYETSFEDGWGMWHQSTTDSGLNWIRGTGQTFTTNTGPDGDHTTTKGYYAYIEAGAVDHRKSVVLNSAELPANFGDKCLKFYYNMNGKGMGSLNVKILYNSGSSMWIWDKEGHQGNYWKPAYTNLANSNEPYRIQIEGIIGISPYSDMAIDDVFIDDGRCPLGIGSCKNRYTNCESWAKLGECHKNPYFMLNDCCLSCTGTMGECTVDKYGSTSCNWYAKQHGCTQNGEWMWENCCKSCKECLDTDVQCADWASTGECSNNPTWMKANCKISCNVCKA